MEIFNEVTIMICTYHLFLFTEYVPDAQVRYMIGWSIVGVTTFNILVNILVVLVSTVFKSINKAVYYSRLRTAKKKLKVERKDRIAR